MQVIGVICTSVSHILCFSAKLSTTEQTGLCFIHLDMCFYSVSSRIFPFFFLEHLSSEVVGATASNVSIGVEKG